MLVIVDYGVGNLASIQNMLKKAGVESLISAEYKDVTEASKLILPGMGAFDNCMSKLKESGLFSILEEKVFVEKTPILGICVGLQMFMNGSEEGMLPGLHWVDGKTIRFKTDKMKDSQKVPNMGWLEIQSKKTSPILNNLEDARFYFAHSFHVEVSNPEDELMSAEYGYNFTVGIEKGNILGVQFHPEKSHRYGMNILKNFSENY